MVQPLKRYLRHYNQFKRFSKNCWSFLGIGKEEQPEYSIKTLTEKIITLEVLKQKKSLVKENLIEIELERGKYHIVAGLECYEDSVFNIYSSPVKIDKLDNEKDYHYVVKELVQFAGRSMEMFEERIEIFIITLMLLRVQAVD